MRNSPALEEFLELPAADRRIGAFHLLEPLGKGGFAPVWLAEEVYGTTKLRKAAVKLFAVSDAATTEIPGVRSGDRRERILEEARALCRVEHPNVVRFYSIVSDERRGLLGLAMEHVEGESLDTILLGGGTKKPLDLLDALEVGVAVASALAVVHQSGLVHRDVKPANVVRALGVYKVIDFGIAAAEHTASDLQIARPVRTVVLDHVPIEAVGTNASELLALASDSDTDGPRVVSGTMGYMDPECLPPKMEQATTASDLYGLGALLYECVTGYVPAVWAARQSTSSDDAKHGLRTEVIVGTEPSPPLRSVREDVPLALSKLVDALLESDRRRRPRSAEAVARELERIREEISGRSRPLPSEDVGPFRGLGRFEEGDRDVYFGRGAEVAAAIELLRGRGLLALVGASGSGKSSLARAGVLPAVSDGALGRWPKAWDRVVVSPGHEPLETILAALEPFVPGARDKSADEIVAALAERAESTGRGLVMLVDQLEELATLSRASERPKAVALLTRLGERTLPGVRVVVAARRDLLDSLLGLGNEFGRVLSRGALLVSPISEATWAEVLDQALAAYGYSFEDPSLRDEILGQLAATATAMPLVQFALTQLWAQRDAFAKRITRKGLEAIGGLPGALDRHAEATHRDVVAANPEPEAKIRALMLALTTAQGTRATRSEDALVAEAGPGCRAILTKFEHERLVVREPEGYAIAHEALLTHWARLRRWLAEAREDRLMVEEIDRDATRWARSSDSTLLWRKQRLAAAEDVQRRGSVLLGEEAQRFVAASRGEERRARIVLGSASLVALVAAIVLGLVYVRNMRAATKIAENNAVEAQTNLQVAQANERVAKDKEKEALDAKKKVEDEKQKTEEEKKKVKEQGEKVKQVLDELTKAVAESKACKDLLGRPKAKVKTTAAGGTPPTGVEIE